MECENALGLVSAWKQGHLLNELRPLDLDVAAIRETWISEKHAQASIFENYAIFSSCDLSGACGGVALLLWKYLDLQELAISLDSHGREVVLEVNSSGGLSLQMGW